MKKIVILTMSLFIVIALNAKVTKGKVVKVKKKVTITTKTKFAPKPKPTPGEWVYGKLTKYGKGIFQCKGESPKCAWIPKGFEWESGSTMDGIFKLSINVSTDPRVEKIMDFQVKKLTAEEDKNGEFIFRTEPPIELP